MLKGTIYYHPNQTVSLNNGQYLIQYRYASFWSRVAGRLLDTLIVIIPLSIVPLLPAWLYWALMQSSTSQATVGQSAMKLVTLSADGSRITFLQASGRFFANLLNALTFLVGFFMYFFTEKKQCLHDLVSGCIVVEEVRRDAIETIDFTEHVHLPEEVRNSSGETAH